MAKRKKSKSKAKKKTKVRAKTAKKRVRRATRAVKKKTAKRAKRRASAPVAKAKMLATLPDMTVDTSAGPMRLTDLRGKNVVLYFYPKDDTPGCTTEGCDIRDHFAEFGRRNAIVLGVSRDGLDSHDRFKHKYGFPFELVSDVDERLCRAFDVIREKSLYGRKYLGIDRSTFIFDSAGRLRKEIRGVKVAGHVDEILNELDKL